MGHRCNYAIRENGEVSIYYSHWGALSVPEDVFWGPIFAESFMRQHEPDGSWLDNVWAEGGAVLDKDERVIVLFGGAELGYPPLRAPFLALMKVLWKAAGWTVRWARYDQIDLLRQMGVDPLSVGCELPEKEDERSDREKDDSGVDWQAYDEVAALLLNAERFNARALLEGVLVPELLSGAASSQVNPHALMNPRSGRPDLDTAQALLSYALACLRAESRR